MSLKLYYDLMSQPSRALYILLKSVKCNFESKYVDLRKGEHYSEEYSKVNRLQKVPVIEHNGFILTERMEDKNYRRGKKINKTKKKYNFLHKWKGWVTPTSKINSVAIINYLSREGIIPNNLYPIESKSRALVQEYLEWQHLGLRLHCAMFFRVKYMDPILFGRSPSEEQIKGYEQRMLSALELLDTKWLGGRTEFIAGNSITVADLMAACELEQPRMAGFDPKEKFPNIAAWWPKVKQHFNPYYDEAHVILNKIVQKQQKITSKL